MPSRVHPEVSLFQLLFTLILAFSLRAQLIDATAEAIEADLRERHAPHGDPRSHFRNTGNDRFSHYNRCGDSAIWTGHYLATKRFRYAATRLPEAQEGVYFALEGVRRLIDVTGDGYIESAWRVTPASSPAAKPAVYSNPLIGDRYGAPPCDLRQSR